MIESLENNEAVLLMYLAEELSADDAAEVSQMLASDANLRAELDKLRRAYDGFFDALRRLDDATPLPGSQEVAIRRIMRLLDRRRRSKIATFASLPQRKQLRYPWWAYPSAAAAAILLASLTWWGNRSGGIPTRFDGGGTSNPVRPFAWNHEDAGRLHVDPSEPDVKLADELENMFKANNDADSAMLALRDDAPKLGDLGGDSDE